MVFQTELREKRCYTVIDLSALKENLITAKKLLSPEMKVIGVVKANSYGLGSVRVAKAIQDEVWGFAVATYTEAVELQDAGIQKPILILSMIPEVCYGSCIERDIRPTFYDDDNLKRFGEKAKKLGKTGLYHLAVDTGMTRIGLFPDESGFLTAKRMAEIPYTRAEGIYTHLATMDEEDPQKAIAQMKAMKNFVERLQSAGLCYELVHAANSAAMLLRGGFSDEGIFNASRYGISLYGAYPSEIQAFRKIPIRPVLSWYGRITRIAEVPEGTEVGYGGTYVTERKTRIATVAAGYADGYPRSLSSKGEVLIYGKRARILGRICMDQFMVDVSEIPEAASGEFAVLVGKDGPEEITVEELSERSGRFPYELFSLITPRVTRIYKE
jgi:alanine racemase